jgi:predicted dienelactone hydrolase
MAWLWIVLGIALTLATKSVDETNRPEILATINSCASDERSQTLNPARAYSVTDGVLHDQARGRAVPYRSYAPAPLDGVYPVILVSHGIGGTRDSMPYLGRSLAEGGYVALHLQHPATDGSVWQHAKSLPDVYRALREAMWDANGARARFQDVPFVLGELARLNREGPLAGHLDLRCIGMAGHSYGGVSTMVAAGQRMGPGGQWFFKEPRVRAGLVMSPNIPIQGGGLAALYRDINIPLFHITGTEDGNAVPGNKEFDPIQRTIPYEALTIPHQYLLVLDGAGHNAFSGLEHGPHAHGAEVETRYTRAVAAGALLFFDGYLKGDSAAVQALRHGFKTGLKPTDRFEWK